MRTSVFKTNEAASLVYTIKGTGNIKYIKEPVIDFPSEFEQYQPQSDINTHISGANMTGTQVIDYTFVAVASSASVNKQSISSKNTDILHIKLGDLDLSHRHVYFYNSWWYWPGYVILTLLLVGMILVYSKRLRLNADIQGRRLAKAGKVAKKRLKLAGQYLKNRDNDRFYEEMLRAIWGYLGDKLRLPASQLTRENVAQELSGYGASDELIAQFLKVIDSCEMARYSPESSGSESEELYRMATNAMDGLENTRSHAAHK